MTIVMPNIERGCGQRKAGGIYAVVPTSKFGRPAEEFIVDFPHPTVGLPVATQGVALFERNGVWHVLDRIGLDSYPYPIMFFEEYRRFGVSRRLPEHLDFSKLSLFSRLFLVHDRGLIVNYSDYGIIPHCPTRKHQPPMIMEGGKHPTDETHRLSCAGFWWHDLPLPGTDRFVPNMRLLAPEERNSYCGYRAEHQQVEVQMGATTFRSGLRPEGVTPEYEQAICFTFSLAHLQIIDGGRSEIAKAKVAPAAANGIEVSSAAE